MRIRLVVPADVDEPTGGNHYDLALADALHSAGDTVQVRRCGPAALDTVLAEPWAGPIIVDGLLACPRPEAVASSGAAVLVHMPLALETGLPADRRDELDRLEREALRRARVVIATSCWSAHHLLRHHGLPGVAVARPGAEPAATTTGSDPPLLLHVAALLPHKDQLGVVAALSRLRDLPWQARLAGSLDRDRGYAAAVAAAVRRAGLHDRVELLGTVLRERAWESVDLALLPSRVETYGMVVSEALAHGIPSVVTPGGAAEALGATADGRRPGVVVPAGDPKSLAAALRRWLTDSAHREGLRAAAMERRDALTGWDVTARQVRRALSRA
ncbi:MAG TPA: glycosyltransferase family 4 protein [Segeticoccus sp.]|jgi:glycosyltransferase involved in cell wall biosynthesis|nr:glycosyltransferase family 4 protein [Segeticoccus sp.]